MEKEDFAVKRFKRSYDRMRLRILTCIYISSVYIEIISLTLLVLYARTNNSYDCNETLPSYQIRFKNSSCERPKDIGFNKLGREGKNARDLLPSYGLL